MAFLSLFVSPSDIPPILQMGILSLVFMAMTLIIFIIYGISANGVWTYVTSSPKYIVWLQRTFAAVFALPGVKLALTEVEA